MSNNIFGYFDSPEQETPVRDPGLKVPCPFCNEVLVAPMKTISIMADGDNRSYFYRVHKACYEQANDEARSMLDGLIIDAIAYSRNQN